MGILLCFFSLSLQAQPDPCLNDTEAPTISCLPNVTVSVDPGACVATLNSIFTPTASDNCSYSVSQTAGPQAENAYAWGYNDFGQMGIGNNIHQSVPVKTGANISWRVLAAGGYFTMGISDKGNLYTWGRNNWAQLGNGFSFTNEYSPIMIGSDTDWDTIVGGGYHAMALKTDGSLYTWGSNEFLQVGSGVYYAQSTPRRLGSDNDWVTIAAGGTHSMALKADGRLFVWGRNAYGQLGQGNFSFGTGTPTQVGTDNDWVAISAGNQHSLALKADGRLFACGKDDRGQLGDGGSYAAQNTMVQVGSDNDWVFIGTGLDQSMAIKADGSLYAWGRNDYGQVGDGGIHVNPASPIRIGTDTDWVSVTGGNGHSIGLKADGRIFSWGSETFGELGDGGSNGFQNSPVQVGGDKHWVQISSNFLHSVALSSRYSLPVGSHPFSYQVTDAAGNTAECTTTVQVDSDISLALAPQNCGNCNEIRFTLCQYGDAPDFE